MDEATRVKANNLALKINETKSHIGAFRARFDGEALQTSGSNQYHGLTLSSDYFNREEFKILYLLRAETHLAELEKQFADL